MGFKAQSHKGSNTTEHTCTGTVLSTGTLFDLLQLNCPWEGGGWSGMGER